MLTVTGTNQEAAEAVKAQCAEWLRQAHELRQVSDVIPDPGSPPRLFYEALLQIRGHLDSMERLVDNAIAMRGSTTRAAADLHNATEDAWDNLAAVGRKRAKEFEGARERYADWNLGVLPQRQQERQMQRLAEVARETEDRVIKLYRGLNDARQDCLKALGFLTWESTLERGG